MNDTKRSASLSLFTRTPRATRESISVVVVARMVPRGAFHSKTYDKILIVLFIDYYSIGIIKIYYMYLQLYICQKSILLYCLPIYKHI